jgi:FkbM family methyltransferase
VGIFVRDNEILKWFIDLSWKKRQILCFLKNIGSHATLKTPILKELDHLAIAITDNSDNRMTDPLRIPDIKGFISRPTYPERELRKIFGPDSSLVIFDIGACEGEDSVRYARLFPNSRVYTFEPLPANQVIISENFKILDCRNAHLQGVALCDKDGYVDFHVSQGRPDNLWEGENWNYGNKSSSILPPSKGEPLYGWLEFKEVVSVPCRKLDSFCDQNQIEQIDFIHLDVQGAELLVLKNGLKVLRRTRCVWLEVSEVETYSGQATRVNVEAFMNSIGFHLVHFECRGEEGDQFYVNPAAGGVRAYLWRRFILQGVDRYRGWFKKILGLAR